ncbi:FKBP-type peptidyl-prolyl cis-trans isomerase [Oceanimonas baumannii]|uniref:Peptidyl-prolyl cis-trans isomerase n=1 Tax=Oceanimonas baumannii TaxID=129578 RepID=A0A235CJG4_9GAMM|nr:FKBP-type peptidyl-prolyl cis-trans isomerase [Oceanimonas baumannii]MCC4265705.1 FKBP-type peptidyl-prolyl cis-trans isomerase [Oceanimonas baumannii]OYD24731.1 peptidylprolyl isomerase [Oceanimonas baumannii]TDW59480.1 FKBP-type peptidyl-prolyl cis-trans isomerase SlpA [Oceanimonas baumannii]
MSNTIGSNSEVLFHFTIKLEDGSVADSTQLQGKPAKLQMGDGSLTDNFESCLLGLEAGTKKVFELPPEDAFGPVNPDNIHYMERSRFGADLELEEGAILSFTQPNGAEIPGIIRGVAGDSVTVDFNHPLAGQNVTFEVEILAVDDENGA